MTSLVTIRITEQITGTCGGIHPGRVVVETLLGPLEKCFPSKRLHTARVGGKDRERWGWFAKYNTHVSEIQRLDTATISVLRFAAPLRS